MQKTIYKNDHVEFIESNESGFLKNKIINLKENFEYNFKSVHPSYKIRVMELLKGTKTEFRTDANFLNEFLGGMVQVDIKKLLEKFQDYDNLHLYKEDEPEEGEDEPEVFQWMLCEEEMLEWYLANGNFVPWYHNEELDLYFYAITHFGIAWRYVSETIKINNK